MSPDDILICFGTFSVDVTEEVLYKNNVPIKLGPIAVRLLIALLERQGQEVTFDQLRSAGWPGASVVETNTIYVHISNLRKAVGGSYVIKGSLGYSFNPNTPIDRRVHRPDTVRVVSLQPSTPKPQTNVFRPKNRLSAALIVIAITGVCLFLYRFGKVSAGTSPQSSQDRGQPSRFSIDGRLLVVSDEHNRKLWEFVFPKTIAESRGSETEGLAAYSHEFLDLEGDGKITFLLGVEKLLYCFRNDGSVAWVYSPGRETSTIRGQFVPAGYDINLVGALGRARGDGGRIVVGAHRGPGALYVVEVLTANGKKVGEYFHFGWFFGLKVGSLDQTLHEDIFLAGVDDVVGNESEYGATLVVLDSEKVHGQAATLIGQGRALKNILPAREKALLLFKEFAPSADPNAYCRGQDISFSGETLQVRIAQGSTAPGALFRLNRHLQLESITADVYLLKALGPTLLRNVPPDRWGEKINHSLGSIRYIRNEFE
jgi:hypothetical protein